MNQTVTINANSGSITVTVGAPLRDTKAAIVVANVQFNLALDKLGKTPELAARCKQEENTVDIKVRYDPDSGAAKFAVVAAKPLAFRAALEQGYLNLSGDAEKARALLAACLPMFFVSHQNEIL